MALLYINSINKCSGGYDGDFFDEIVEFSPRTGKWSLLGNMMGAQKRGFHAVSVIKADDVQKFCS